MNPSHPDREALAAAPARVVLPLLTAVLVAGALLPQPARASGLCTSDGQSRPVALMERFINADCESCWTDPGAPSAPARTATLDWIVPGTQGEEAALSAAATRDALLRLEALRMAVPDTTAHRSGQLVPGATARVRVAQGPVLNRYLGASVEIRPLPPAAQRAGGWRAWLALVEDVAAGEVGSPVARSVVRGLLEPPWSGTARPTGAALRQLLESRVMAVPEGANLSRLRVVGWVEDAQGRLLAAAESRCQPERP